MENLIGTRGGLHGEDDVQSEYMVTGAVGNTWSSVWQRLVEHHMKIWYKSAWRRGCCRLVYGEWYGAWQRPQQPVCVWYGVWRRLAKTGEDWYGEWYMVQTTTWCVVYGSQHGEDIKS